MKHQRHIKTVIITITKEINFSETKKKKKKKKKKKTAKSNKSENLPKISQELQTQPGHQERLGGGVPNITAKGLAASTGSGE
jgi:replication initiation and membrane attachment protein DnaB